MLLFGDTDNLFTSDLEIRAHLFDYLASLLLQSGKCGRPEQTGEQWFIVVETALISISSLTEIHLRDVTIAFNIKLNQHINCISLSITSVLLLTEEWVCKDWIDENFSDFFDNLLVCRLSPGESLLWPKYVCQIIHFFFKWKVVLLKPLSIQFKREILTLDN